MAKKSEAELAKIRAWAKKRRSPEVQAQVDANEIVQQTARKKKLREDTKSLPMEEDIARAERLGIFHPNAK